MPLDLVGAVLAGVLGGRRKRSRNALRYLGGGGGGLVNATTLMTAAGLAWGAYEAWQQSQGRSTTGSSSGGGPATPLPVMGAPAAHTVGASAVTTSPPTGIDASSLRLLRLAVAAANADGSMSATERQAVVAQARSEGASDELVRQLEQPGTLAGIVAGAADGAEKAALYVVAFTVVRADEQVSGAERIFLAQLANLLGLDPQAVASLEKTVAARIDAQA
jgi:uncharacterized membrane protein YebE (DUF533 family)